MDIEFQQIMQEFSELKSLIIDLKKSIDAKDMEIKELKELITSKKEDGESIQLKESIDISDPDKCYQYVYKHKDMDFSQLEKIVLDSKDLDVNYKFMKNIEGCDFKAHLKVIMDSKDPHFNYYSAVNFPLDIDDVEKIKRIIIDSGNVEYNYQFACDLGYIYNVEDTSNIDISELEKVVLNSYDFKYYYKFCKKVKGANISLFENILLESACYFDIQDIFNFAVNIKGANLDRCKSKIVELYNEAGEDIKEKIVDMVGNCEKQHTKCLFRSTFGDQVVIK